MRRRRRAAAVVAAAAAVALLAPGVARATAARDAAGARAGIAHALKRHWLKPADAARYRAAVGIALRDIPRLPPLRGRILAAQLRQMTTLRDSYTSPRALALFSQLTMNVAYLATHRIPEAKTDVVGPDGVVYRWFDGQGLEFHPLAEFAALNDLAARGDAEGAQSLAAALVARAIPRGRGLVWEYAFPYGSGRPPWTSGMAQATAAQALARAGARLADPSLTSAAARAFQAVRDSLLLRLAQGPWIRLYSFDHEIVLNAQLQTIVSLGEYARATGDPNAAALAAQLAGTTRALLPSFDTGDWSLYELHGFRAPRDYQQLVTNLTAKIATQTADPFWIATAARFHEYFYLPASVIEGTPPPTAYPQPADGWLDTVRIPITLSHRASLTLAIAGQVRTYRFASGAHVLAWTPPPTLPPGSYPVQVSTLDYAGHRGTYVLAPVVVAWDTAPAQLAAAFDGTTVTWSWTDPGTPWLDLGLELTDPAGAAQPQTVELGRQPNAGSPTTGGAPVTLPAGTWQLALTGTSSAGQTATVDLGAVTVPG